jgi:hypothetical protein
MSSSSQPTISSITLNDVLTDTITIGGGSGASGATSYTYNSTYDFSSISTINSGGSYTISTGIPQSTIDTITLNGVDASQFTFKLPEEWIDSFPAWGRVEDMCEQYPGLKIAFENFKVVYEMVKDDYDNPVPKK